ncbi:MAG: minor capsid protein 2 [Caudoviricetes sp.]|nr:MAG: minor capsid protein 2 [Caudoviricetes sp.]
MDKLDTLLDDVVERNQAYYIELIDLAQVTAPERLVDEADIAAIRRQTWGAYKNITGSMGFLVVRGGRLTFLEPAKAYENALDSALVQVQSGAISYNQAIASEVKRLADSGLKTVSYESGHVDSVDVAVRRAVMSGVNALNQRYREQSMDYLGTNLVEVTAHLGARNVPGPLGFEAHSEWQGKVFAWNKLS